MNSLLAEVCMDQCYLAGSVLFYNPVLNIYVYIHVILCVLNSACGRQVINKINNILMYEIYN